MSLEQFVPFVPEIALCVAALAVLLAGIAAGRRAPRALALFSVGALAVTAVLVLKLAVPEAGPELILGGMLSVDGFAVFFKLLVLVAAAVALPMAVGYVQRAGYGFGEFAALVLFATVGMMVMASGANLASLYVGLELMALSVYILVGFFKLESKSNEGAVKYFVLGAFSSAVLLYGMSLVYGGLGTLDLAAIGRALAAGEGSGRIVGLGIVMVAFGMLFKVAAVPFHVWTPDAYEGAPTPVTGFISVAPKAAAFAMFLRLFLGAFRPVEASWHPVLWAAAALTMVYGNVAALTQNNVKRMLAYSSIAHAGYALLGIVAANEMGAWSVGLYMLIYTFMNLGAFGFVSLLESRGYAGETVTDYAGLARRAPAAAAGMLVLMLGLAGIPPTGGFMGKLYVFSAAVKAGYVWLVVIAVIMSAVSLYYYFRIVVQMYLRDGEDAEPSDLVRDRWLEAMIAACVVVTLILGVWPGPALGWAQSGLAALGF